MIYNSNSTSTIQNLDFNSMQACKYRLPCGYCRLLSEICPNSLYNTPVYRTEITGNVDCNKNLNTSENINR